ncbi:MAG: heavy metal translocating P-type ATPase metal-binding domain-containing protein [Bacteroidetes bacterium]|nr:heavy metal translocating P-type ATPase metal-binding domain-containing protein [Bacteroidota bacterium]
MSIEVGIKNCLHCGNEIVLNTYTPSDNKFCCTGCKSVYEIINNNGLCEYYSIEKAPGLKQNSISRKGKFLFLQDGEIASQFIKFQNKETATVVLYLPQVHCSSCIWILEHLHKINKAIITSQVDFLRKEITLVYNQHLCNLSDVAETLSSIGYEPHLSLSALNEKKTNFNDKKLIFKIGIAGFCFANIMLLAFPEYFGIEKSDYQLQSLFSYLSLLLSLPVLLYSSSDFFISIIHSYKQKYLNIDTPIALAIAITFIRSVYEIITKTGSGYLDSMSGIVFFMLVGRYFQNKNYFNLSFNRDYKSYFPVGVSVLDNQGNESQVSISKICKGTRIKVYDGEIVPADAILFYGNAHIDYSFVSGESKPITKQIGEIIYAGGKQIGGAIELEVVKEVSQSYLTNLWNNKVFQNSSNNKSKSFIHFLSKNFTIVLFLIAFVTSVYWVFVDANKVISAVTAILIIACPCALLLSATFTFGHYTRYLSDKKVYCRNAETIERLCEIDTIVFDKTGTVTLQNQKTVEFFGDKLSEQNKILFAKLFSQSNHPLSRSIKNYLNLQVNQIGIHDFIEIKGKGISAKIDGVNLRAGSPNYIGVVVNQDKIGSKVFIEKDGRPLGYFIITSQYRKGINTLISNLKRKYAIAMLSGDNSSELEKINIVFGTDIPLLFNQSPHEKLQYIEQLNKQGKKTIMIGDGLNDAGALAASYVGISVSDNINNFTPASDIILKGDQLFQLDKIIRFAKSSKRVIMGSFIISILYNIIGLWFAVQGNLQPVIAAILMPLSSFSIMIFTSLLSYFYYKISFDDINHD